MHYVWLMTVGADVGAPVGWVYRNGVEGVGLCEALVPFPIPFFLRSSLLSVRVALGLLGGHRILVRLADD